MDNALSERGGVSFHILHFTCAIGFIIVVLSGALSGSAPTRDTDGRIVPPVTLGSSAELVVAVAPGLLLEGNVVRVAVWSFHRARKARGNSVAAAIGGSSPLRRFNVAIANIVGSNALLLGGGRDVSLPDVALACAGSEGCCR